MIGNRFLIPSEKNNENASSKVKNGALFAQVNQVSAEKEQEVITDPLDAGDAAVISSSTPVVMTEPDPQFEVELAVFDKALSVYNRSNDPEMNHDVVVKITSTYSELIQKAETINLPEPLRVKFESMTNKYLVLAERAKQQFDMRLELIMRKPKSDKGEDELNNLADTLEHFYYIEELLRKKAKHLGLTNETIVRLQNNIDLDRSLAERVVHIATKKNYTLKNLDRSLGMAEKEGNEYIFMINDPRQVSFASNAKMKYEQLLEKISDIYEKWGNANMPLKDDNIRLKLLEKKHDLAELSKKYVKKLSNKKLKSKLKAEVIVLAFLLKNPSVLNRRRIEELRTEIGRIRWQSMSLRA